MDSTMTPDRSRFIRLTPTELAARKRRNLFIALALVAFMVLLFTTTFLRMLHNQEAGRQARAAAAAASAPQSPVLENPAPQPAPAPAGG